MLTTMAITVVRKALNAELSGAKATVRKHMTASAPRRIAKIEAHLVLPLPPTHASRAELEDAGRNCPVALSLHPEIEKVMTFEWVGAPAN